MILKYLSTGLGQPASVLRKTLPNRIVSLVHHFPAMSGDITRTCLLLQWRAAFLCKCYRTADEQGYHAESAFKYRSLLFRISRTSAPAGKPGVAVLMPETALSSVTSTYHASLRSLVALDIGAVDFLAWRSALLRVSSFQLRTI